MRSVRSDAGVRRGGATQHVSVRLTLEQIARIDALIPRFSTTWRTAKRSDSLRALLLDALERFEAEPEQKGAKKGGRR